MFRWTVREFLFRKISLKESYDPIKAVIPGKTLNEISKILSGDMDDDVRIYFTDRHVLFEFDQTVVVSLCWKENISRLTR